MARLVLKLLVRALYYYYSYLIPCASLCSFLDSETETFVIVETRTAEHCCAKECRTMIRVAAKQKACPWQQKATRVPMDPALLGHFHALIQQCHLVFVLMLAIRAQ